ncbi:MAG: hypothetical protein GY760_14185 [Deltaproteobacteria bacterium]|nr:hypothetical protein [Deltaproteobacteria bacterium]
MQKFTLISKNIVKKLDENFFELLIVAGLSSLFYGLQMKEPWIAYSTVGGIATLLSLIGIIKGN